MSVVKDSLKTKFRLSDTILRSGGHRMGICRCLSRNKKYLVEEQVTWKEKEVRQ